MPSHPLTNLLEAFPDLLSTHLLPPWPYSGDGIKLLRAVSKELGAIAGPAVHSCKVEGGGRLSSRARSRVAAGCTSHRRGWPAW